MAKKPAKSKTDAPKAAKPSKKAPKATPDAAPELELQAGIDAPMLRVLAQYVKDASFENPGAPESLRADLPAPGIDLNVEVKGAPKDDNTAEVAIFVTATAKRGNDIAFICEIEYAGLFAFANIPVEQIEGVMLVECPRILFPFIRQLLSSLTQQGGFPPLMLDPIDFAQLYQQQRGGQNGAAAEPVLN
ncbi:protein-export chaperone SecB [Robiginitomaculum antarcticum]|uniref:protein-export chaperone SecB n=1 Tax=Robiginitomaculum antarcticum TaxID=437507 RepID=UPI00037DFF57|nr:protein-export chaperone SecB [Robiginitomaculum antarcticum]